MNLDEGLEPAYVDVAGLKVAFVAWNDVGGVARADADTAGVPWITQANINEGVRRARDGRRRPGHLRPAVVGRARVPRRPAGRSRSSSSAGSTRRAATTSSAPGTHVAGPMLLRDRRDDVEPRPVSPGNYVFGQDFWQNPRRA